MEDQVVDITICQQLNELITQATESGQAKVEENVTKEIKKVCRVSSGYIKHSHHLLMTQLRKEHAEIRLSAVQVIDQLFMRSHVFRELLIADFNEFLDLTVETDMKRPLPPPEIVARNLKRQTLEAIRRWNHQFGKGYRKLELGYVFLKEKKHVDFEDIYARSLIERQEEEKKKEKAQELAAKKRECVSKSMEEFLPEIKRLLTEMTTCFELLIPTYRGRDEDGISDVNSRNDEANGTIKDTTNDSNPENLTEIHDTGTKDGLSNAVVCSPSNQKLDNADEDLREHGMLSHRHNVVVVIDHDNIMQIRENADNCDILDLLSDSHRLLKQKYLFMVGNWLDIMTRAQGDQNTICKIIDIRDEISQYLNKFEKLTVIPMSPISKKLLKNNVAVEEDDDSSDEFIEVGEQSDSNEDDVDNDLLGFIGTKEQQRLQKRKELLALAPIIPYGVDLYHWEDKDNEIPRLENKNVSDHRFWFNSNEDEVDIPEDELVASVRARMFTFPIKHEPIRWMCRAPLPSGKLCQRRDKFKCPFHGIIVPRNAKGQAVNPDGSIKEDLLKPPIVQEPQAGPSWKDIQGEIEAATGITFTKVKKKRKGSKNKIKSKLTDLKVTKDTSRHRLETKIFKPSAIRKVKKAQMDEMQKTAHAKFMHNWNYSLRK